MSRQETSKLPLHWKIIIGMAVGALIGVIGVWLDYEELVIRWIKPFGIIFIKCLKLIAVPLIIASLIKGISGLSDVKNLTRIGTKTIGLYLLTTIVAVSVGLILVNITNPGSKVPKEAKALYQLQYADKTASKVENAQKIKEEAGPLQFLVDIVPDNIFSAAANNRAMLQVIFFSLFFGIALVTIPIDKARPVIQFFDGLNDVILKMIDFIMKGAPYGVGALIATVVVDYADGLIELLQALGIFFFTVVAGLGFMIFIFYPMMIRIFAKIPFMHFLYSISPAQLLAFSTSSSAATLPVTMERCEQELGISEEISSFVLPLGATINMDGTSLYLGVASLFIAQAFGVDLSLQQQIGVVLTCTLASIGTAAVPGASIIMLFVILQQAGIPVEGMALIFPTDRLLDMMRTSVNVTGDAMIASVVARGEDQLSSVSYLGNND